MYRVKESQTALEICVIMNGILGPNKTATASISQGDGETAESNTDFIFIPETIQYSPGTSARNCRNISILMDDSIENDESFHLTLSSNTERVIVSVDRAEVIIEDSTQTSITFLNSTQTIVEGGSVSFCFMNARNLERDVVIQINVNSTGGEQNVMDTYASILVLCF